MSRWQKPPRRLALVALLWLFGVEFLLTDAGVDLIAFFALVLAGFVLAAAWLIRGALFLRARVPAPPLPPTRGIWWGAVPLALALAIGLYVMPRAPRNPLFQVRFQLSEPFLRRYVQSARATHLSFRIPRPVGFFLVWRVDSSASQVRLTTARGFLTSYGLVYSLSDPPERVEEDFFTHLRGPWWHLIAGF